MTSLIIWFSNMQNFRRGTARANTLTVDEESSESGKTQQEKND